MPGGGGFRERARFYTAGFLSGGSNYLELLQHVEAWVFATDTVRVVYPYEEKQLDMMVQA